MTTVYTHIAPFPKRAINFFKQRTNEIGARGKINSELDELFGKLDFFKGLLEFRSETFFTPAQRMYIRDQGNEVKARLVAVLAEQELVASILLKLDPCPACEGRGEILHATPMYGTDAKPAREKCTACDGEGVWRPWPRGAKSASVVEA